MAYQASELREKTPTLSEKHQQHLAAKLQEATTNHARIAHQSQRWVNGKKLAHGQIVQAYDTTIAAMVKGKSNCPVQLGKKPGICAEMASGFLFAWHVPPGNPSDASYVLPLIERTEQMIAHLATQRHIAIHSLAGDMALNDNGSIR